MILLVDEVAYVGSHRNKLKKNKIIFLDNLSSGFGDSIKDKNIIS